MDHYSYKTSAHIYITGLVKDVELGLLREYDFGTWMEIFKLPVIEILYITPAFKKA